MKKSYLKEIATETIGTLLGGILLSLIFLFLAILFASHQTSLANGIL